MAGGQHKAVPVQPCGFVRMANQTFAEKHRPDLRRTEGQAEVAGVALMDSIHGETTGLISGGLKQGGIHDLLGSG